MGYLEWKCPRCGKVNRETCNAWAYGSPIRYCKFCNSEYLDKRWREIAIDGYDPKSQNPIFYLCGMLGFIVFTIVCVWLLITDIRVRGSYPVKLLGCVIIGISGTVLCLVVLLRNILGIEKKQNERYYYESMQRMKNKDYVEKLVAYGYDVPDEFR